MQIKDISVSVERLDEVRGGTDASVHQFGLNVGGNVAAGVSSNVGAGNDAATNVYQDASQYLSQDASVDVKKMFSSSTTIDGSVVNLGWPFAMK